ncbi:hypothetical protein F4821DRAFT_259867 [Hypoxylon rubiginosum]|uniref:Uncharacterized protein n=1 Tax=Hypoxylon rubiginosum TaxID=110542 RepID=A0ACC0D260_9PEZI|nr:hypothetical protein F4821DRAFT_259867 [Hypoxylon rubiginosum]
MESRSFKKLAPAPVPASNGGQSPTSLPTPGPRKNLTRNCDGNRPACGRCKKSGDITCQYEANRRDILKLQLLNDNEIARLQNFEVVFAALQGGTDQQATDLLAQIRLGESADILASALNPSVAQPSTSASPLHAISSNSAIPDDNQSVSQGFLDLLFDREDWLQPTETTTHGMQTPQEEMQSFVSSSMAAEDVSMSCGSGRPFSVSQRTYNLPISTNLTANHLQDGFPDGFDESPLTDGNQPNHYATDS